MPRSGLSTGVSAPLWDCSPCFDGYDTFNPAYVIHYVAGPWGLKAGQAGLLISSGLVGFLLGAALHGVAADRFGRRGTLLAGLWITSIFTLLTAVLANSFATFCALRLLTGLGLGVLLPLATTYINELAPRRVANTFALWGVALGWAAGGALAGVVGVFATPSWGWQGLYWIGSLSFLLLPFMHWTLPESPKFLAIQRRGREDPGDACETPAGACSYLCVGDHSCRQQPGVGKPGPRIAPATLPENHDRDLGNRLPQPVLHLWSFRMDPDGDDSAGRDIRDKFRIWRAHADHVLCRRNCSRSPRRPLRP